MPAPAGDHERTGSPSRRRQEQHTSDDLLARLHSESAFSPCFFLSLEQYLIDVKGVALDEGKIRAKTTQAWYDQIDVHGLRDVDLRSLIRPATYLTGTPFFNLGAEANEWITNRGFSTEQQVVILQAALHSNTREGFCYRLGLPPVGMLTVDAEDLWKMVGDWLFAPVA